MARPITHAGGPYTTPVVVKMNTEALAALDRLRGDTPRGAYLRDLLRAESKRR